MDDDHDDDVRELARCCWNPLIAPRKMPMIEPDINDEHVSALERWQDRGYLVNG